MCLVCKCASCASCAQGRIIGLLGLVYLLVEAALLVKAMGYVWFSLGVRFIRSGFDLLVGWLVGWLVGVPIWDKN